MVIYFVPSAQYAMSDFVGNTADGSNFTFYDLSNVLNDERGLSRSTFNLGTVST